MWISVTVGSVVAWCNCMGIVTEAEEQSKAGRLRKTEREGERERERRGRRKGGRKRKEERKGREKEWEGKGKRNEGKGRVKNFKSHFFKNGSIKIF